jgi:hypothetical protein
MEAHLSNRRSSWPDQLGPREILIEIGRLLDEQVLPEVWSGGCRWPNGAAAPSPPPGQENRNVRQGTRRPAAGSGSGTARWKGATGGEGATDTPASVVIGSCYAPQLSEVDGAYPGSHILEVPEGIWLLAPSRVLHGLERQALFLLALPNDLSWTVQAWAFWEWNDGRALSWVGPRHTNFPTGSICAFEPKDGTWKSGGSLVTLLDIYSLWAARHIHLEWFNRWPGSQVARWPYERLTESLLGELCGCGTPKLYVDCCFASDKSRDLDHEKARFLIETGGGQRYVPTDIVAAVEGTAPPPFLHRYLYRAPA